MTHRFVNPDTLLPPVGFAHGVIATGGSTLYLGGQTGHHADGTLDEGLLAQFGQALTNLRTVLDEAGARPDDLVSMQLFVTDIAAYRAIPSELGAAYREALGRHYPAMALFEVTALHDPDAMVEIVAIAVLADDKDAR